MEFKITTDLSQIPAAVEFNFEELKADLAPKLDVYKNLLVTPDTIKDAKDDKAKLNKLRTAIEDKRKEVKKVCMTPYEAFEVQCKEIVRMIDEPVKSIDEQIKAFEEKERKAKYDRLKEYFLKCTAAGDVTIKFDRILNPKWANKSMKEAALQQEICDRVITIQEDFRELQQLYDGSPHLTAVLNCYMQGYDKGCALAYAAALVQQEQRRQWQEAQRNAQQNLSTPLPQSTQEAYDPKPPVQETSVPSPEEQRLGKIVFRAIGTRPQLTALVAYMNANGIQYEAVKVKE